MCGIVGYIGGRQAYPILIKGLHRLEYRGYDSAGVAVINKGGELHTCKQEGKVSRLEEMCANEDMDGTAGIGHTRWATHGQPNNVNAHPHKSAEGDIVLVHNGIIENYAVLKEELEKEGHTFESETDTEVLAHFIGKIKHDNDIELDEAVRLALKQVNGAYAIVVIDRNRPNMLVAARKGSPMVIGVGHHEYFIASDATPIIEYSKNVLYLKDEEVATITREEMVIKKLDNVVQTPQIQALEMELEQLEKGGYEHFMLKEIFEQPKSIEDCLRGRIIPGFTGVSAGGISAFNNKLKKVKRIIIVACGTSWHAGLVGEYLIEELARIPVEVEYASEFRYRNPIVTEKDVVIAISQSGETADTMAALEMAKQKGATILGVCNVIGASIPRLTDAGLYTHAGPEIGVASTKAFTAQVTVLTLLALYLADLRGTISKDKLAALLAELHGMPYQIKRVLECNKETERIAGTINDATNCLFLGRGVNFPVALEGALKLKEISYIHAEGYPAAEMKHGPIALIDEQMPVVFIAVQDDSYEKIISNIQEVKARKGRVIAIVTEGDTRVAAMADEVIEIPRADQVFVPLLASVPLQLLSYHTALMRGCNVDQPRNLAKSVTVE